VPKSAKVKPIPEGFHTVTPGLRVRDAAAAIDFYERAFGAEVVYATRFPDGRVMHAELCIGDSRLFVGEEMPQMGQRGPLTLGGTTCTIHLYVRDVDTSFARALKAGATVRQPIQDQFWGDRIGSVTDPYGHVWSIGTRREAVPPEEIERRGQEWWDRQLAARRN